jgi:hypothetical protein
MSDYWDTYAGPYLKVWMPIRKKEALWDKYCPECNDVMNAVLSFNNGLGEATLLNYCPLCGTEMEPHLIDLPESAKELLDRNFEGPRKFFVHGDEAEYQIITPAFDFDGSAYGADMVAVGDSEREFNPNIGFTDERWDILFRLLDNRDDIKYVKKFGMVMYYG